MSIFCFGQNDTIACYLVATAGGDTIVDGISVSWTLGEIAIETLEDDDHTLIFQQAFFEITSIGEAL